MRILGSGAKWHQSMRVRILAVVVGLLLLSSIGSVLLLRTVMFDRLDEQVATDLDREAREFELLKEGNDPRTGEPFDGDLRAIFDVYFSREVPDEGESLLAFVDGGLYQSRRAQDAGAAGQLQSAVDYWLSLDGVERGAIDTSAGEARYTAIPLQGQDASGLFVVANFPAFERAEIDEAVRTALTVQLLTLVVASLLGLALAGRVLRPLRSLAVTARRISETDLTRRIPVSGKDEATQIAEAFNDMLTRLEGAFTTQRQFIDDASHELRTPLTIIRGHLELLETGGTPEERAETVALVTDEIDRMGGMVKDLFLLARSEHPDFLAREALDLKDVVQDARRKVSALAPRNWQVAADTPVRVLGDRHRLEQAILQLAANAVKFTSAGDTITIGANRQGDWARIWVDDTGVGVAPQDAPDVFKRFHRGANAGRYSGSGLGLAIVHAIAEAHGGGVALVPKDGRGARFEITLPISAPRPGPASAKAAARY